MQFKRILISSVVGVDVLGATALGKLSRKIYMQSFGLGVVISEIMCQYYSSYSEPIVNPFLVIINQINRTQYPTRGAMSSLFHIQSGLGKKIIYE